MSFRRHEFSRDVFEALAAGGGGAHAVRELARAQASKHWLLLLRVAREAEARGNPQAPLARHGFELLARVAAADPAAAIAAVRHPSVAAWALGTARALRAGASAVSGAEPARLCAVAAAAAIRAGMPAELSVPTSQGLVLLPSLGAAAAEGIAATVCCGPGNAVVQSAGVSVVVPRDSHQDAPGWHPLRRLTAGSVEVLIDDLDPSRMPGADTAPRLGAVAAARWQTLFERAWRLIGRHHPTISAELAEALVAIVPLVAPARGQASCSSRDTFGAVALSEPADPTVFALLLAHEVQHLKLSAVIDTFPLTEPDDGRRFYVPWREDARPAAALLQGAYAHLGVTAFWSRQRLVDTGEAGIRAHAQFALWRAATAGAIETLLGSGTLTAAGTEFVQIMSRTVRSWQDDPVPPEAEEVARSEAERPGTGWHAANRGL